MSKMYENYTVHTLGSTSFAAPRTDFGWVLGFDQAGQYRSQRQSWPNGRFGRRCAGKENISAHFGLGTLESDRFSPNMKIDCRRARRCRGRHRRRLHLVHLRRPAHDGGRARPRGAAAHGGRRRARCRERPRPEGTSHWRARRYRRGRQLLRACRGHGPAHLRVGHSGGVGHHVADPRRARRTVAARATAADLGGHCRTRPCRRHRRRTWRSTS